jgi:hypothetical protein
MVRLVVDEKWPISAAAAEFNTSARTCSKWVARYREASEIGLLDRSSACRFLANRTDERRIEAIAALRRLRFTGPEIAELLDMPLSTVSGILSRIGLGRLGRLGLEPAQRYERSRPGELIHIDVKKLGRIVGGAGHRVTGPRGRRYAAGSFTDRAGRRRSKTGWEFVHIAIDDATRLAYAEVLTDGRIPAPRAAVLCRLRDHRRTRDDRQRLGLHLNHARPRLPRARRSPSAHPAAATANQRKGRALHPHHARRLGLRRDLPRQPRTHRSP